MIQTVVLDMYKILEICTADVKHLFNI